MRWRQASNSAHPGPMLLREDRNRFRTNGLRACGPARQDTGPSGSGPARQKAMPSGKRAATGSEGASASEGSGRTGFRPGSCEPGMAPGLRLMTMSRRNQGFGRGSCPKGIQGLRSLKTRRAWKRDASSESAERRTARASALRGEPAGKPDEASAENGPRRKWGQDPVLVTAPRNRPSRKAASANRTRRDSGARQQCRAPLLFGGLFRRRPPAVLRRRPEC